MRKEIIAIVLTLSVLMCGCTSTQVSDSENPVNRSVLFDAGINFELNNLPITLPGIGIGVRFKWRRPSIEEEIDLNLSKLGKIRGEGKLPPPSSSPTPKRLTN